MDFTSNFLTRKFCLNCLNILGPYLNHGSTWLAIWRINSMVVCQLSPGLPRLVLTGSSSDTLSTDNEDGKFKFLILIWFLSVVNGGLASSDTLCTDTEDSRLIEPGRRDVSF